MTHLAIDGDLLAFKAAAVNEERSIVAKNMLTGEERAYALRTELKNAVGKADYQNWKIKDIQVAKNFKFSCNTAEDLIRKWVDFAGADSYEIVLTGENNFRDNIPLPRKYKSNRNNALRPLHVKKMKQWLVDNHAAAVTDGCECDDKLAELAYLGYKNNERVVQVTIDKDAYGCDGWIMHMDCLEPPSLIKGFGELNLVVRNKSKELKGYGKIWMLAQSVLGDESDGYKPCELSGKKFGDVSCYNLLRDCVNVKEAMSAIYSQYKSWYPTPVTYTAWDGTTHTKSALEIWQMYFDCARMRRFENDIINLADVLDKLGVEY